MKGPRFQLVRRFGSESTLRDVDDTKPTIVTSVGADIAFMRVVQNDGQGLDTMYRNAPSMTYSELQKYRYVIDVDGNGTS
jgi:hypothetical protein